MPRQDDLRAEIKQLQEENEKLRQKLEEEQETLSQDRELTQGVKKERRSECPQTEAARRRVRNIPETYGTK